jgi:hypothetical protein
MGLVMAITSNSEDNFFSQADALLADTGERFDYVLTNPSF